MIKFDIILPTIGRNSLESAILSVINQNYPFWNLWLIADQVIIDKISSDERIFIYEILDPESLPDSGARARNFGINQGSANWIAYIDDDDEWAPNHLTTIVEIINQKPDVNMIKTAGQSFRMKHKSPRSSKLVRKMDSINFTDILTVGIAHTRDLFKKTNGWQSCDNHDHLLWKEMLTAGGTSCISNQVTFYYKR